LIPNTSLISCPGEVIKHHDLRIIQGEGMPVYRNQDQRGDLIIQFQVDFPERLSPKQVDQLRKLLPNDPDMPEEALVPDGAEHIKLVPISEDMLRAQAREEEMRNGGGPQAVRCATQ